jgi:uncharacterized membrane protein
MKARHPGDSAQMGSPRRGRIEVIDSARGTAMLFVFLSHFVEAYFKASPHRSETFRVVTRLASPAFVSISGITLAVLFSKGAAWVQRTRDRLIDRAAFLLLVAHPLMIGAYFIRAPSRAGLRFLLITDTIAVCLVVGALLIPRIGPWRRAALGVTVLLIGWSASVGWMPPLGSWAWKIKDTLVGDWRDHWANYVFPVLPWLGFYVLATALGPWFVRSWDAGRQRRIAVAAAATGAVAFVAAAALNWAWDLASLVPWVHNHLAALAVLATAQKLPPTPVYFLRYGGLALVLFSVLLVADETAVGRRVLRWVAIFGRCSVVAYILQYYVYYALQYRLPHPPEAWAPLYFVSTVFLLWVLIRQWERANGNRLITVGYPGIFARGEAPTVATSIDGSAAVEASPTAIPVLERPPSDPSLNARR